MTRLGIPELSPSKRGRILALRDAGFSYRQIAARVGGVAASTCVRTVQREQIHHTRHSLPRSGRPPSTTPRDRRVIERNLRRHRFDSYRAIAERVGTVTARQVRTIARQANYRRCVAQHKPFLSQKAVRGRREWVKENQGRDWEEVIWTDEATIETGTRPGCQARFSCGLNRIS
jgi:hypothetical protein